MTASRVKDGTEGKRCLDPAVPLLLSPGLQQCARRSSRVRGVIAGTQEEALCAHGSP